MDSSKLENLKTPLYEQHVELGAKIVPFAGYSMPVQYKNGVISEHMATRQKAGLFDVSHMGEIFISGKNSFEFLQKVLTNDYTGMENGDCRYSPMCNEQGGVVDDLIVYKHSKEKYMLVVNASNKDKDYQWLLANIIDDVKVEDFSSQYGELALQGPEAEKIISKLCNAELLPQKSYTFKDEIKVAGINCLISRTGYTGEDGFELYCCSDDVVKLWNELLNAGEEFGLVPCGLAARDTLRLEAGMPLYGHEMNDEISPVEANLGFFVKRDKENFIGKSAIDAKPKRRRSGLKITGRGIARENCIVYTESGKEIGYVTSGTQLPYVGYAGAMAMIDAGHREIGEKVLVDVRGRKIEAEIIKLPFYKRK